MYIHICVQCHVCVLVATALVVHQNIECIRCGHSSLPIGLNNKAVWGIVSRRLAWSTNVRHPFGSAHRRHCQHMLAHTTRQVAQLHRTSHNHTPVVLVIEGLRYLSIGHLQHKAVQLKLLKYMVISTEHNCTLLIVDPDAAGWRV